MKPFILAYLLIGLTACHSVSRKDDDQTSVPDKPKADIKYAFFAAGHVYGNPMDSTKGIYSPFMQCLNRLYEYPKMEFGLFTGDVVRQPTPEYWDAYERDHEFIKLPVHLIPGNHDRGEEFEKRGYPYYQKFTRNGDLFIFLSPTNWNIENQQLEFLEQALKEYAQKADNIFIGMHELIWWHPENEFGGVKINYEPHFPGQTNYWEVVHPLLQSYDNDIYLIAGDLGCTDVVSAYSYHQKDNVHFLASGMGGGKEDNILVIEVDVNGDVHPSFKKLPNLTRMMPIEAYELPKRDK